MSHAQATAPVVYTDPDTGIIFDTWSVSTAQSKGGMTMGFAMPEGALETDATEYIGLLVSPCAPVLSFDSNQLTHTDLRLSERGGCWVVWSIPRGQHDEQAPSHGVA